MALLVLNIHLSTRWRYLYLFQNWLPGCITCIVTLHYCLGLPYWHHQLVLGCNPHQPESHQLSQHILCHWRTSRPTDRTPGTPGSGKKRIASQRGLLHLSLIYDKSNAKTNEYQLKILGYQHCYEDFQYRLMDRGKGYCQSLIKNSDFVNTLKIQYSGNSRPTRSDLCW